MLRTSMTLALLAMLALPLRATAAEANSAAEPPPARLTVEQLRAMHATRADRLLVVDGVEVYYRDEGRGPAVLLIHGSNSTLRSYDALAKALKPRYRVVRYDIPPVGLSGRVPDSVVGRLRPSDVPARLLEHLGIRSATVVGVSSGGTTGVFLAAEHPALVERLVISCAPANPVDMSKLVRSPALIEAERRYGDYLDAASAKPFSFWRTYVDFYSAVPGRLSDESVRLMTDFLRREPERNATALIGVVADQQKLTAAAAAVKVPVLLLWGAADPLLPPPAAGALARRLVNMTVSSVFIPDASHYPPYEIPDRFAAIVDAYVSQVTPAQR
jgi:pimeloyl-ACP methyl ester carboxylesterase